MKRKGFDINDCCYEEMSHNIGGQSIESECWDEPMQNSYELNHKDFYGRNGFDWSGMRRSK
jgi:hypothetical protein